ncbi:imidazole glycerol phosphate synthase subunit HisF [Candidatus Marinamargulisbacteria bacterium SCGC AG-410-N11]|nr:imidazole glycerol phosphate synthase subunit HisF [Candidatus Marinamargulisbacteria bacterium SCGC AG-410-N11]
MLTKRIIPCLDVTNGRVVKGTNFVQLRDAGDPIELAKLYDQQGADELVFLDITASSDKRKLLIDLVEQTAKELFIPFTVGGGIGDIDTIRNVLNAGADKVSINTAAVQNPSLINESSLQFGSQCIVVAIDARRIEPINIKPKITTSLSKLHLDSSSQWEVFTHGGRYPTGIDALKWAQYLEELGAGELLVTSMNCDGTKEGYDIPLTHTIAKNVQIPVIASGGAGNCSHISDVLLGCEAALLASLLHFQELTISDIKTHCIKSGISIRH